MSCLHHGEESEIQERKDLWKWMTIGYPTQRQFGLTKTWRPASPMTPCSTLLKTCPVFGSRAINLGRCISRQSKKEPIGTNNKNTWISTVYWSSQFSNSKKCATGHDRKRQILSPNTFTAILIMQFAFWGIWSVKPRGKQKNAHLALHILRLKAGSHWLGQSWAKLHWDLL